MEVITLFNVRTDRGREKTMKVLVIGLTESGKTLVANEIARILKSDVTNISDILIEEYAARHPALSADHIRTHKLQYRSELWLLGREFQYKDPGYMARKAVGRSDIVTGVRDPKELESVRGLFDVIIWVDRAVAKRGVGDLLMAKDADVVIDNNGSIEDAYKQIPPILVRGTLDKS